jgi:hypothetical protein
VLKVDLEMPGWAPVSANEIKVYLNGALVQTRTAGRASYLSLYVPLPAGGRNEVRLEAGKVFPLPHDSRERAFLIKNISFENQSRTDLFARGWHQSGYLFSIDHADNDGWVDRRIDFSFPATDRFKMAYVDIVRFPAHADLPLAVSRDGGAPEPRTLELEKVERIAVPLSAIRAATLSLSAPRSYPLAAPDTRERSFRIVNIDFE